MCLVWDMEIICETSWGFVLLVEHLVSKDEALGLVPSTENKCQPFVPFFFFFYIFDFSAREHIWGFETQRCLFLFHSLNTQNTCLFLSAIIKRCSIDRGVRVKESGGTMFQGLLPGIECVQHKTTVSHYKLVRGKCWFVIGIQGYISQQDRQGF